MPKDNSFFREKEFFKIRKHFWKSFVQNSFPRGLIDIQKFQGSSEIKSKNIYLEVG